MHPKTYILDDNGNPVPEPSFNRWCLWLFGDSKNQIVRQDELDNGVVVSTAFLGIDHDVFGHGPPILWETVIIGGPHDRYKDRCSSRSAALKGHDAALALAKGHKR